MLLKLKKLEIEDNLLNLLNIHVCFYICLMHTNVHTNILTYIYAHFKLFDSNFKTAA